MDGWNVKTLKCYGWKAKDDKLHDGWASWRVVDVESPNCFVLFYIWFFYLVVGYMLLMVCYSWERCYRSRFGDGAGSLLVWWWNRFLVGCVMACWWKCVSHCVVMVGGKFDTFDERWFAYLYKWSFPWMERRPIMGVKFSSNVHVWFLESVLNIVNIDD